MLKSFSESISAGILISIGGCVLLACDNRYIGAVLFSVALLSICYLGCYLFTGKIGFLLEDLSPKNMARLLIGLAGNLLSVYLIGLCVRFAIPSLGNQAESLFASKLTQSFPQTLIRAIFCGVLMYIAVVIFRDSKTPIGILFCIPVFILCGFEHSVADMFYFGTSGLADGRAWLFFVAAVLGNTLGSLILPLLQKIGGKSQ